MPAFAALDVPKKSTSIHVVDETGACLWRGKVPTEPDALAAALAPFAADPETGCWSISLCHELCGRGLPVVCMDARQAQAALSLSINKTDANDARGLAQLLRTGLFREVRVKGWDDVRMRMLIHARRALLRAQIDLGNAVHGALRTFGLMLGAGPGSGGARAFDRQACEHLASRPDLVPILMPMLEAWRSLCVQVVEHNRAIRAVVRADPRCRLLMTAPGVGHLTALAFVAAAGERKPSEAPLRTSSCGGRFGADREDNPTPASAPTQEATQTLNPDHQAARPCDKHLSVVRSGGRDRQRASRHASISRQTRTNHCLGT